VTVEMLMFWGGLSTPHDAGFMIKLLEQLEGDRVREHEPSSSLACTQACSTEDDFSS
jgi:hypothetical protein